MSRLEVAQKKGFCLGENLHQEGTVRADATTRRRRMARRERTCLGCRSVDSKSALVRLQIGTAVGPVVDTVKGALPGHSDSSARVAEASWLVIDSPWPRSQGVSDRRMNGQRGNTQRGRGCYVHLSRSCIESLRKGNRLAYALRGSSQGRGASVTGDGARSASPRETRIEVQSINEVIGQLLARIASR